MYTQGNHNPQPRQGPPKPVSSSPYQQLPPGPPAPLPQFQQAPSGFTSYQHGPAAPHQIRPGGLPDTGHSYLHPPAHVHAGAPLPQMYPPAPHTSQHQLHLGTQNVHNMPQPLCRPPINASYPEVSQAQPPFRALPPPPPPQPQGQTFFKATVNAPPQQRGLQYISSHPPLPPTTSFFTSAPLGSFVQSTGGDHVPSTSSLPPPPPLPPNLPYPPPTSTAVSSSKPVQYVSNLPCNLESDGFKLSTSGSVDEVVAPNQVKHNLETDNSSLNMRGGNECDMDSLVGDKIPLQEGLTVDLSSTPPKPTDEIVIEKIEAFCQSIAKNGPDYEDMVRKNESGNPDYAFLYGGEPGSEAAIAHNFFLWMKKKSIFSCKSDEQQGVSFLRPSEKESSEQPFHFVATGSHLPDDSDMEMEDDITQIDEDQGRNQSLDGLNSQCNISDNTLKVEEQVHSTEISTGCNAFKSNLPETISAASSSRLGEQGQECITTVDQLAFEASVSEVNVVKSTVPTKGGSPFRLLQDYASDDNSEKDVETRVENRNVAANLGGDFGSSLESATSLCLPEKGFGPALNMPYEVANSEVVERTIATSIKNGNEHADNKHIQQVSANHAASVEVLQEENIMVGDSVESVKFSQEHKKEEEELTLGSQHKVDKFGRLVRNGGSDSGSDDSDYTGRHRRGRTRSRSRSRSPPNRRKRRSPRRRKKRSVSHSWSPRKRRSRSRSPRNRRSRSRSPRNRRSRSRSPRNRRSRSRSPYLRRADEFGGENKRRVKGQMQFCFDFRRGRCYRGLSCRFLHQDSGKSEESRRQRSTGQHLELPHTSRTNVQDETNLISEKAVDHGHGEVRGPEAKLCGKFVASRDRNTNLNREDSVGGSVCKQDGQSTEYHMVKSEESRDIQGSVDRKSLSQSLDPVTQIANCPAQQSGNSSISDSSHKTAASSPNRLRESNAHPNTMELHNHPSHIDNPDTKQLQTASSMFHSSGESFPSYMLPDQQSYFALQPESSLASLPPPPLRPQDSTKTPVFSSHFQQSQMPLRNDFGSQMIPRPYPTALPAHSQSDGFQQRAFIPIQEANRPFIHTPSPVCNLPVQQLGAPGMSRDDGLTHPPMQNVMASNSFTQGNTYPRTLPINKIQPFPSESLRPVGLSDSSSYIHPYPQKQQPPHGFPHPVADHIYNLAGKMNSSLEDPPDIKDATSHHIDIGVSTSSTFPNPYAPTLDQPINSKYHSHVLQEQGTTYNSTPFSLTHPPVDGKGIGLQQATSSPNSARTVGQNSSRSGGDQYDPLFDSFEPSTRLSRKVDYMQKLEVTGDSGILLGLSGSNEPLDMEEKNKDAEAITSAASADNEEFGETADAEVGAVENESPSHPVEVNMATSEIEIDQIKSPGKSKKSKDSRSMKHFKVAIADFVKEVLKPSWQQGNMSKEAFKTIVKKTVDKVSGAMKNHQIPKSRAKIDHYIESSQRKLTKLVMGYVDKYVKV